MLVAFLWRSRRGQPCLWPSRGSAPRGNLFIWVIICRGCDPRTPRQGQGTTGADELEVFGGSLVCVVSSHLRGAVDAGGQQACRGEQDEDLAPGRGDERGVLVPHPPGTRDEAQARGSDVSGAPRGRRTWRAPFPLWLAQRSNQPGPQGSHRGDPPLKGKAVARAIIRSELNTPGCRRSHPPLCDPSLVVSPMLPRFRTIRTVIRPRQRPRRCSRASHATRPYRPLS